MSPEQLHFYNRQWGKLETVSQPYKQVPHTVKKQPSRHEIRTQNSQSSLYWWQALTVVSPKNEGETKDVFNHRMIEPNHQLSLGMSNFRKSLIKLSRCWHFFTIDDVFASRFRSFWVCEPWRWPVDRIILEDIRKERSFLAPKVGHLFLLFSHLNQIIKLLAHQLTSLQSYKSFYWFQKWSFKSCVIRQLDDMDGRISITF